MVASSRPVRPGRCTQSFATRKLIGPPGAQMPPAPVAVGRWLRGWECLRACSHAAHTNKKRPDLLYRSGRYWKFGVPYETRQIGWKPARILEVAHAARKISVQDCVPVCKREWRPTEGSTLRDQCACKSNFTASTMLWLNPFFKSLLDLRGVRRMTASSPDKRL